MIRQIFPAVVVIFFFTSCSVIRPLNFTSSRQTNAAPVNNAPARFINDITVTPQTSTISPASDKTEVKTAAKTTAVSRGLNIEPAPAPKEETRTVEQMLANRNYTASVEDASSIQLKYAILMNTEVENLPSKSLLETVDSWYGVRYRTGGNTHSGVDCSGFTCAVYAALYGYALPRVSRDQYNLSRKISTTELQEGDLVFFNTKGNGVSHVGVYLGNNKFIHASVSRGVMVSGLFEPYYIQRFVGAGRIEDKQLVSASN